MHFFKHFVDAGEGKFMNDLMDYMGVQAYAHYFLLVELCAEQYDPKDSQKYNFEFAFHERIVRQKLRISRKNLRKFLEKCSELSQKFSETSSEHSKKFSETSSEPFNFTWEDSQNEIKICLPKLLECLDRDAKKARKAAADPRDSAPKNKIESKEEDKDKELKEEVTKIFHEVFPLQKGLSEGIAVLLSDPKPLQFHELADFRRANAVYRSDCIKNKTKPEFIKHFHNFAKVWRDWAKEGAGSSALGTDPQSEKAQAQERARRELARTAMTLQKAAERAKAATHEGTGSGIEGLKSKIAEIEKKKETFTEVVDGDRPAHEPESQP